ncbi:MAG: heavy metal translocating P-type ATPase [Pseudomonadales bacterium]
MNTETTHCFHCQELLARDYPQRYSSVINNTSRFFCCPACAAVADTIYNLGLEQYYRQRDEKPQRPTPITLSATELEAQYQSVLRAIDENISEIQLFIPDIHCTSCCWLIEKRLLQLAAVREAHAQFHSHKLTVRWHKTSLSLHDLLQSLQNIGYRAAPWLPSTQQETIQSQQKKMLQRLGVAGILAMQIHMVAMGSYFGAEANIQRWLDVVALLLSLPLWFYCADIFFSNAKRSLSNLLNRKQPSFALSMDIPIALAIVAAAIASIIAVIKGTDDVYFDSIAMFVFLLLGARFLETQARNRLTEFAQEPTLPQTCVRLRDEKPETISTHSLQMRDCVLINNGIVPVDGTVLSGSAAIEQAIITGEFLPVQKQAGDTVIAGTTLISGELIVQAEHWGADSHIAHLHQRMEQALSNKQYRHATARLLYEKVAQFFTPIVLTLASGSALFWWWTDAARALPSLLAVLVASCPCALTLALPTALTAATLQLRRHGILITGSHVLQMLPSIAQFVFDKTGTLTQGRMHVIHTQTFSHFSAEDCLALAGAMEHYSLHPIASAFRTTLKTPIVFAAQDITSLLHCGIEAKQHDDIYRLGKPTWACDNPQQQSVIDGAMPIYLSKNGTALAVFFLGDPLRATALHSIQQLQSSGIHCTIASGDHSAAVQTIANTLSMSAAHRNCTPEQKVSLIENLRQQHGAVLMVGDGINDGPVLAHADISVALADASQTAQLAADVILLNNRLDDLLVLRSVALRTQKIVQQSLIWALLYNLSILPLAAIGWLAPVHAAIGMALSSLLVTLNALRLFPRQR